MNQLKVQNRIARHLRLGLSTGFGIGARQTHHNAVVAFRIDFRLGGTQHVDAVANHLYSDFLHLLDFLFQVRVADFLKTRSGDAVSGISLIELTLTKVPGIEQMQLVQESIDQLLINRVKGDEYTIETDQRLLEEFQIVFGGDTAIVIEDVDEIPQLSNGKYRFSICNI